MFDVKRPDFIIPQACAAALISYRVDVANRRALALQNLIHLRMTSLRPFGVDKRLKLVHLGLHHGILRNDIGTERNEGLHHRGLLLRWQLENLTFVGKP
jgi:hypothetical protein